MARNVNNDGTCGCCYKFVKNTLVGLQQWHHSDELVGTKMMTSQCFCMKQEYAVRY